MIGVCGHHAEAVDAVCARCRVVNDEPCATCGGKGRVKTAIGNWPYCTACGGRGRVGLPRVPIRHKADYCQVCGMSDGRHWTGCTESEAS